MLASRKRPPAWLAALCLVLIVFFYHRDADRIYLRWAESVEARAQKLPANRTLGFGAVFVVSKESSNRRHSLLQAANVTDIELRIPLQPAWNDGDVRRFRNGQDKNVQRGSILAWLGHHNALRWFLDSGFETALILEDDVDWDIRLRSLQIPLAASAARLMLPPARSFSPHAPFSRIDQNHTHYWGNPSSWDLLYLGHCGDYFREVSSDGPIATDRSLDLMDIPHKLYHDPSLPQKTDLHPFTRDLFSALGLPDHHRAFHRSQFPLCSFGYAITRPAAERLLTDLAPAKLSPNGPRAFDVALLEACTKGSKTPSPPPNSKANNNNNPSPHPNPQLRHKYASAGLRCWTLNSELFHHMPGESQIAQIGEEVGEIAGIPPVDLVGRPQITERNETTNIACGFWLGGFGFEEGDKARLAFLKEQVGKRGRCLKYGREAL